MLDPVHSTPLAPSEPGAIRHSPAPAPVDPVHAETLRGIIDKALQTNLFCEPERGLIVQIVCDALLRSNVMGAADEEEPATTVRAERA